MFGISITGKIEQKLYDFPILEKGIKKLLQYLPMAKSTLHEYVKDIIAKNRETKNAIALRLFRLGWTQEEIGEVIGMKHQSVQEKMQEFPVLEKTAKNLLISDLPHEDVAKRNALSLQTVWGITQPLAGSSNLTTHLGSVSRYHS